MRREVPQTRAESWGKIDSKMAERTTFNPHVQSQDEPLCHVPHATLVAMRNLANNGTQTVAWTLSGSVQRPRVR